MFDNQKRPRFLLELPSEILCAIVQAGFVSAFGTTTPGEAGAYPPHPLYPPREYYRPAITTLYNLCFVSRRLRDAALPVLYREFAVGYGDHDGQPSRFGSLEGRLAEFFHTLIRRRDLAALVRHAFLDPRLLTLMSQEEMLRVISEASRVLGTPESASLASKARDGTLHCGNEACVTFLAFALMPNLEHMALPASAWLGGSVTPAWPRLKSLEFIDDCKQMRLHPDSYPRPHSPVVTLTLHGAAPPDMSHLAPMLPHVVNIRLVRTRLELSGVESLIGAKGFSGLQSFHYILELASRPFYNQIISLLSRYHADTLRHLTIETQHGWYSDDSEGTVHTAAAQSFRQFTKMESLVIDGFILAPRSPLPAKDLPNPETFYAALLPPSLKILRVIGTRQLVAEPAIFGLRESVAAGELPNLCEFWCTAHPLGRRPPRRTALHRREAAIRQSFAQVGVYFRVFLPDSWVDYTNRW